MNQLTVSLWGDEGWAATLAVKPILEIIRIVARDTSPPFYYLCLHTWMKIFGTSEIAIRSLSVFFFLATALTVFFIARHLWDKKTGFLAALLVLTNPFLFIYAFEGRMYATLLLTTTLSVYFFLKKNRPGFILATAASLYTHHFALFVVFWEGLWTLKESWGQSLKTVAKSFLDFSIIGLLYIPWLYPLYYQTSLVGSGFWLGKPTPGIFLGTIWKFLVGSKVGHLQSFALGMLMVTLLLRNWLKDKKSSAFLLGWFFVPLFLSYFISQFFQSIFFDRYMLMVIPAGALILASLRRRPSLVLLLIVISLLTIGNYQTFFQPVKRPFRQLADYVKSEAADLTLINYNADSHHLWESKYYGLEAPIYSPQPLPFYTGTALMEEEDVIQELPDQKEIGVISSAPPEKVKVNGYSIKKTKQFNNLWFLWLEKAS